MGTRQAFLALMLLATASVPTNADSHTGPTGFFTKSSAICLVADPSPTPLNVRATPNGAIVGWLINGAPLTVIDYSTSGSWALVKGDDGTKLGWVYREYLDCRR
jgi:Bacterial SH3 domain